MLLTFFDQLELLFFYWKDKTMSGELTGLALIFFARVADVTLGTFRIVLVARGFRGIAPILGFFEVFIWITAIGQVLNNLNGLTSYLFYAGGFATGNYAGMVLESLISIGYQSVRIITSEKVTALPLVLREEGFGITTVNGRGMKGDVILIYTTVHRGRIKTLLEIVETMEPGAFITIEDVKIHKSGFMGSSGLSRFRGAKY